MFNLSKLWGSLQCLSLVTSEGENIILDDLRLSISRKYKTEVQEVLEQGNMVDN